jgi:hypothetical protein
LFLLGTVDLLLLDEVHHLGEDRGSTLETVVVRMRILSEAYKKKLEDINREKQQPKGADGSSEESAVVQINDNKNSSRKKR